MLGEISLIWEIPVEDQGSPVNNRIDSRGGAKEVGR